jgi:type IV pilus assembly protein PilA
MNKIPSSPISAGSSGFTLIEILLAIGILAILATAAIIAINPARQFAEARDTQRWSDVHAIMNAISQYAIGHKGALPPGMPTANDFQEICQTGAPSCDGLYNMQSLTENAIYLTAIPKDPACPDGCPEGTYGTGYFVTLNSEGRIDIQARYAERGDVELIR